jgi:large subunit ribosomal protein L29
LPPRGAATERLNWLRRRGFEGECAIMKPEEFRGMSEEQLDLALKDELKNLFHLRFQSATERLETPSEIRKARRNIARIKTIQRERQLAGQKMAAAKET